MAASIDLSTSARPSAARITGWLTIGLFGFAGALAALSGPSVGLLSLRMQMSSSQENCPCVYCPPEDPLGKAGGQEEAFGAGGGDPCCGGEEDHNPGGGGGAGGGSNMPLPSDGQIVHSTTDIASGGFGGWGHTRVLAYPCKFSVDPFGFYKESSWKVQEMSRLAFEPQKVTPVNGALWQGRFGSAGAGYTAELYYQNELHYDATAQEFTLFDTTGGKTVYDIEGLFKRYHDPAGNVRQAFWGTIGSTNPKRRLFGLMISGTENGQTVTEIWEYFYWGIGQFEGMLVRVDLRRSINGGPYNYVRQAYYSYMSSFTPNGTPLDLEFVTVTDGLGQTVEKKYYRYHPTGRLWMALSGRATARLMAQTGGSDEGVRAASHGLVEAHANLSISYESFGLQRVTRRTNREAGGRKATSTFAYAKNAVLEDIIEDPNYDPSGLDKFNTWESKVTETLPDNTTLTTYMSMQCMPMLKVYRDAGKEWRWWYRYDSNGRLEMTGEPSAVSGYDELKLDLVDRQPTGDFIHIRNADGLIHKYSYYGSSTGGGAPGYRATESIQRGDLGVPILMSRTTYLTHQIGNLKIFPPAGVTSYRNTDGTGGLTTTYSYAFHTGSFAIARRTTTHPVVGTDQNGSGLSQSHEERLDLYGRLTWSKDEDGFIHRRKYDLSTGALSEHIGDVNVALTPDEPSGWTTPAGGGLHRTTTREIDPLGRATRITDPKGNITYRVYNDLAQEIRTYPGWNTATNRPTGPTLVHREDWGRNYDEFLAMSAVPAVSLGRPTGTEAVANLERMTRIMRDPELRQQEIRKYHSFSGISYSAAQPQLGSFGAHYDLESFSFDARWRIVWHLLPTYSVEQFDYDGLSRPIRRWKGVPDSTMYKVEENVYDNGGAGDGNLTRSTLFASDTVMYHTDHQYDWRNRRIKSRGPDKIGLQLTFDNLGQATRRDVYADGNTDFTFAATELRRRTDVAFDNRGRPFRESQYEVSSGGTVTDRLVTDTWYNGRSLTVKNRDATGLFSKSKYDGLGRAIRRYTCFDAAETTYDQAKTVASDTVVEQTSTIFDQAGNIVLSASFQANDNIAAGQGELTTLNSFAQVGVRWYDKANRITHACNYGRDNGGTRYVYNTSGVLLDSNADGIPNEAQAAPREPNTSSDYIVDKTEYDSAGFPFRATDNLSRKTVMTFDRLGRTLKTINNHVDGVVGAAETETDQTVERVYGYGGKTAKIIAYNPKGTSVQLQETRYSYGSPFDAAWVTHVVHPDSTNAPGTGTDQEKTTYDRIGRKETFTDQRGVVRRYLYDGAGRQSADVAETLPAGVDGTVRRIGTTYDDLGRPRDSISYSDTGGATPVNAVRHGYNAWGKLSTIDQNNTGAVGTGTPRLSYAYADGAASGLAQYVRMTSMTYPTSRTVHVGYPAAGTIGQMLNRVERFASAATGGTAYAHFTYGGTTDVVKLQLGNGVVLDYGAGGTYSGLDRFGRITDQKWMHGTVARDRYVHTYDRVGNRLTRDVLADGAPINRDEAYTYDGLNRLKKFNRGTLSGGTIADTAAAFNQQWTLDALGNWKEFKVDPTGGANSFQTQLRAFNKANEIDVDDSHGNTPGASISGTPNWIDPKYDAAGAVISGPSVNAGGTRQHFVYDAWGRMVEVKADSAGSPGTTIAQYRYNGLDQRVRKILPGTDTYDYYYNEQWQVVEVRRTPAGSTTRRHEQYLWDPDYLDAPIVRWRNADNSADGTTEQTVYYLRDANWNVTALTNTSGAVLERYAYDAYGLVQIMDAAWAARASSSYGNENLFAGMRRDPETGLYQVRHRYYHPALGSFLRRDPILENRPTEHYAYCFGRPITYTDPMGLHGYGNNGTPEGAARAKKLLAHLAAQNARNAPTLEQVADVVNWSDIKAAHELATISDSTGMKVVAYGAIAVLAIDGASNVIPGKAAVKGAAKGLWAGIKGLFRKLFTSSVEAGTERVVKELSGTTAEVVTKAVQKVDDLPPVATGSARSADNAVDQAKKTVTPDYGSGKGRRGSVETRKDIDAQRDKIQAENPDWNHVGGGTNAATGKQVPEVYVPGPGGSRKGSTYPDLTFEKPDGTFHHHNTVDTMADGSTLTPREAANKARLQAARPADTVTDSPKPK